MNISAVVGFCLMSNYPPGVTEGMIPGIDDRDISVSVWVRFEIDLCVSPSSDMEDITEQTREEIKRLYPDQLEIQDVEIV